MRPNGDDLYLGVAVELVIAGAVVATMFLRRFVRRPLVGGAAVVVLVLIVLAVEPRRATDIASPVAVDAVRAERVRRPSPPALVPAPPAMRRVPIPSTLTVPAAPLVRRAQPRSSDQPPPPPPPPPLSPQPPLPPASTTTSVPAVIVLPTVPTTVVVTTTTVGDG